jgi:transcriptional regulator with XRE-family HTH domain
MDENVLYKTPGSRLKYIRENLLKLSRAEVAKKYGLSVDTLAAWENEKISLTDKGLDRCIKIFNSENLIVSRAWMLSGEGVHPNFTFELNRYFKNLSFEKNDHTVNDAILLAKEIEFFRSLSSDSITVLVSTGDMLPLYAQGDYVGGRFVFGNQIENCIAKDCIVYTKEGDLFIRRLAKNKNYKTFNLVCINPEWGGNPEPVIFDVEIEKAAPIIWHRRTFSFE